MSRTEQLAELDNELQSLRNGFAGGKVRDVFSPLEQSYKAINETGTIQKQRLDNEIQILIAKSDELQNARLFGEVEVIERMVQELKRTGQDLEYSIESSKSHLRDATIKRDETKNRVKHLKTERETMETKDHQRKLVLKNQFSLYNCLTNIVWHESEPHKISGNVSGLKPQEGSIFAFDTTMMTPFEVSNRIWDLLDSTKSTF